MKYVRVIVVVVVPAQKKHFWFKLAATVATQCQLVFSV